MGENKTEKWNFWKLDLVCIAFLPNFTESTWHIKTRKEREHWESTIWVLCTFTWAKNRQNKGTSGRWISHNIILDNFLEETFWQVCPQVDCLINMFLPPPHCKLPMQGPTTLYTLVAVKTE